MGAICIPPTCPPFTPPVQICHFFAENPDGGTISFDNVPFAMLPILQAITFDTWTDPMFDVMDAYAGPRPAPSPPAPDPSCLSTVALATPSSSPLAAL